MQPLARELYYRNKHPLTKNCILCTVIQPPWCNVNTGTTVASSKWLGLINVIAQVVLGQHLFAYFRMCTVVSSNHPQYYIRYCVNK